MSVLLPWGAGFIGLGVGVLVVGGGSLWLCAFAGVPWALTWLAIWP